MHGRGPRDPATWLQGVREHFRNQTRVITLGSWVNLCPPLCPSTPPSSAIFENLPTNRSIPSASSFCRDEPRRTGTCNLEIFFRGRGNLGVGVVEPFRIGSRLLMGQFLETRSGSQGSPKIHGSTSLGAKWFSVSYKRWRIQGNSSEWKLKAKHSEEDVRHDSFYD